MLGQERTRIGADPTARAPPDRVGRPWSCSSIPNPSRGDRGRLSVGAQQLVEVARALVTDARVIVFDEPTSSLTEQDAERLFAVIGGLRDRGAGDRLHQPLPGGGAAGRPALHGTPRRPVGGRRLMSEGRCPTIIAHMVGRDLNELFPRVPHSRASRSSTLSGLSGRVLPSGST